MAGSDPFPTTLAFLQNQWFHKPDVMRRILDRQFKNDREDFNHTYLFWQGMRGVCKTGRMLLDVFGEKLCDSIIWQEASPEIAGKSSGAFPADLDHIAECLNRHRPRFVLAFGKIAQAALRYPIPTPTVRIKDYDYKLIEGPHPAARHATVRAELINMMAVFAGELKKLC